MRRDAALAQLLDRVGGPGRLARMLDLSPAAVSNWRRVPPRWLPRIERLTDVGARALRPDLYETRGGA